MSHPSVVSQCFLLVYISGFYKGCRATWYATLRSKKEGFVQLLAWDRSAVHYRIIELSQAETLCLHHTFFSSYLNHLVTSVTTSRVDFYFHGGPDQRIYTYILMIFLGPDPNLLIPTSEILMDNGIPAYLPHIEEDYCNTRPPCCHIIPCH